MGSLKRVMSIALLLLWALGCDNARQGNPDASAPDTPQLQDRAAPPDMRIQPRTEPPPDTPDTPSMTESPTDTQSPEVPPLPPLPAPTTDLSDGIYDVCFAGGHLPGRTVNAAECQCIAKLDETPHTPGTNQAKAATPSPDPRATDPRYAQWTELIKKTHCACCHNSAYKGPGAFVWDLGFKPVWWDSASDRTLQVMADRQASPGRSLPVSDIQLSAFKAFVDAEIARREKRRKGTP